MALDSTLSICNGIEAHYLELNGAHESSKDAYGKLKDHSTDLMGHKRTIEDLLLQTEDISNLV